MRIEWHEVIDTTQRRARERVEQQNRRFDAVCADHQTAGRGRQGAIWHDTPTQSLLVSIILWDTPLPEPAGIVGVCAALATAEALEAHYPNLPPVQLKYPNDLMVQGRKLGGVLVELSNETAIVGVGVNLRQTAFPDAIAPLAVSVWQACGGQADADGAVSREERAALISEIGARLQTLLRLWRDAPVELHALWQARDDSIGRAYRVQDLPDQPIGIALGVSPEFQLSVRLPKGERHNTYYVSAV